MPKVKMWTTDEVRILKAMYKKHGSDFDSWEFKLDGTGQQDGPVPTSLAHWHEHQTARK